MTITPNSINPLALPSVLLEGRANLPTTPCIYFAIDARGVVQYIGRSKNLKQRWKAHNKGIALASLGGVRVAYLECDVDLLPEIEQALINWFQPPLNTKETSDDWIHGEKKGGKQFMLTDTASAAIDAVAKKLGISRSEVVERAARCGGMETAAKYNPKTGVCDLEPEE